MSQNGFTFLETVIVCAILVILAGLAVPALFNLGKEMELQNKALEVEDDLWLAKSRSLSSRENATWGVYFSDIGVIHSYTLFKGASYATRDMNFDEIKMLPKTLSFGAVNFSGGSEIVFSKISGSVDKPGSIKIFIKDDPLKFKNIYASSVGVVSFSSILADDSSRLKDSRHAHFDYSRLIDTNTEFLRITFEGAVVENIPILSNMSAGQIEWEKEVDVAGAKQIIRIHTHHLNDPVYGFITQFCVHRDRCYNNKALDIDISGDPNFPGLSPLLIRYDAGGITIKGNSFFVSDSIWQ